MKHLVTLLMLLAFSTVASAQHLLNEDFTAAEGTALTDAGWTQSGSSTTAPLTIGSASGISLTGYAGSGVGNALPMANYGQDVYREFAADSTGSMYLSFLVNVSEAKSGDYFIALSPAGHQTYYYARLHLKSATGGFQVGISKTSEATGGAEYGTTTFNLNTTYLMVVKYTFAPGDSNDPISVYVLSDSASAASEPATPEIDSYTNTTKGDPEDLGIVTLRQGGSSYAPTLTIDGIRIGTTWNDIIYSYYVHPTKVDFGAVNVGESMEDSVFVTNYGAVSLNLSSVTSGNTVFAVTPTSATIQPADSQKFAVTYTPSTAAASLANLTFTSSVAGSADTVVVEGSGIQAGFSMEPTSLSFGDVIKDSTQTDTVIVSNNSTTAHLVIDSIVSSNNTFSITPATADIDTAASDTFLVAFAPIARGAQAGNMIFFHNAASKHDTLTLSGTGITKEPYFLAASDTLEFDKVLVGKTATDTVTIKNDGYDSLFISGVSSGNSSFTVTPSSARIGSMESQKFVVTFAPSSDGVVWSSIAFTSNAPEEKDTVWITGTGSNVVSIAEARKDDNGDLQPDHMGETMFVAGVITSPNVQTFPRTGYFLQDNSGGIEIFSYDSTLTPIAIGDSVFVAGKIDQYRGLTEIVPLTMDTANFKILKHKAAVPKPKVISASEFNTNPEKYEGSLIEIDTLYYASGTWPNEGSDGRLYYMTKAETDTVFVFIDKDTKVDGSAQPEDPVNLTGILSQYSSDYTVYDDGYELVPRDTTDMKHVVPDAVTGGTDVIPKTFYLNQNYPNPFNPATTIEFGLPKQVHVQIAVYNVLGQHVTTLVDEVLKAGSHRINFNGNRLASGVYFYVMHAGDKVFKHKMLFMK